MASTHAHRSTRSDLYRAGSARGFTLVELMVAIALGLFLVIGLLSLLVSNTRSRAELDNSARQIENGRFAIHLLSEDLQHAGFNGSTQRSGFAEVLPTPCSTDLTQLGYTAQVSPTPSNLPTSVGALPTNPSCVTDRKAGTAMLLLTRAGTESIAVAAAEATQAYLQVSNCDADGKPFAMAVGSGAFPMRLKDCATVAPLRKVIQRIYFVGTDNQLKMVELVNGANTTTPLAEGIEDLQFDYGVDTDGDGAPDCYTSDPDDPAETSAMTNPVCPTPSGATNHWGNVVDVRVHVLARNNDPSGTWQEEPNKTYEMGLAKADPGDGAPTVGGFTDKVKRRVYSATARLNNLSGQRENP